MSTVTIDNDSPATDPLPDQESLVRQLHRAERNKRTQALLLVLPLLAFVIVFFVFPIGSMLFRSIDNPTLATLMPDTVGALEQWDYRELPSEPVFAAMAGELKLMKKERTLGQAASRLNMQISGMRSLMNKTARKLKSVSSGPYREAMISIDKRWGLAETWSAIKILGKPYTPAYYLAAVDMTYDGQGQMVSQDENRSIYVGIFGRTLWLTTLITVLCVLLGYPLAYLLATLPTRTSNLLMIMVLLPFWTSLLVRTTSWIVMLQGEGIVNNLLIWIGLIDEPLEMMYNQVGTVVAMTHIMLPFLVLPLYSVMKNIDPSYMRAATSLGATRARAFVEVYLPQTLSGVGAGSILVFIMALGYYITPALVGGRSGQMISNFIAYHMQTSLNWGLASALGAILLAIVLILYGIYNRIANANNLKLEQR